MRGTVNKHQMCEEGLAPQSTDDTVILIHSLSGNVRNNRALAELLTEAFCNTEGITDATLHLSEGALVLSMCNGMEADAYRIIIGKGFDEFNRARSRKKPETVQLTDEELSQIASIRGQGLNQIVNKRTGGGFCVLNWPVGDAEPSPCLLVDLGGNVVSGHSREEVQRILAEVEESALHATTHIPEDQLPGFMKR